jgi:hypothetical protein
VRTVYGLDGLLPAGRSGLQEEVNRAKLWVDDCCRPLDTYQALMTLKETNRDCFYGLLSQNIAAYLPLVYTPTGDVSFTVSYGCYSRKSSNRKSSGSRQTRRFQKLSYIRTTCNMCGSSPRCGSASVATKLRREEWTTNLI